MSQLAGDKTILQAEDHPADEALTLRALRKNRYWLVLNVPPPGGQL